MRTMGLWQPLTNIRRNNILIFCCIQFWSYVNSWIIFISPNKIVWILWCKCSTPPTTVGKKKTHLFKCLSISVCMRELTPAKNWRSTMKKSFPLIDMSKLVICKRRSCFAKCNFWLSPIQNVSRSIDVTNFVFYKTTNVFRNLIRRIEGKNWCYLNDKVVTCIN